MNRLGFALILVGGVVLCTTAVALDYDFGDYKSATFTAKAWKALDNQDYKGAVMYTKKCVELYGEKAAEMQASLNDYPVGTNEDIHALWALNDVATCLYLQGKAFLEMDDQLEAKRSFLILINEFPYGQCWDSQGWFWKPAEAAEEELKKLE